MEEILSGFKPVFSRVSAYACYVVIVIGLMIRSDRLGLTSVIRDLALHPETYERMLAFSVPTRGIWNASVPNGRKSWGKSSRCLRKRDIAFSSETARNRQKKAGVCRE